MTLKKKKDYRIWQTTLYPETYTLNPIKIALKQQKRKINDCLFCTHFKNILSNSISVLDDILLKSQSFKL